jgi:integrase
MSKFPQTICERIESYIDFRCSHGCTFRKQAATLRTFGRYVEAGQHDGPLTQDLALTFVLSCGGTTTGRARRYGVLQRFADYLSVFDTNTEIFDPRALPTTRAVPPPRILSDEELGRLMSATRTVSPDSPLRGQTLETLVGLLASTGLRSGEALRLDRADVDLGEGILQVRRTKFRKDRLVPVHATTLAALRAYARARDTAFAQPRCPAFFVSIRGSRLSKAALYTAFHKACSLAGVNDGWSRSLRPHDMRHRFATARLAAWHRENHDVQALLPLLATYLGHVRYNDTAYYITGTAELLGLAAARAFAGEGGVS